MEIANKLLCDCGKTHYSLVDKIIVKKGAIKELIEVLREYKCVKPFVVCDVNTYDACGKSVMSLLSDSGLSFSSYVFNDKHLKPDEYSMGKAVMHYDQSCDMIIGVGSGVINDICKMLSKTSKNPYVIVATAPSMDGYASATSSMDRDGLKVSIPSKCANVIIGDIDVLKNAPMRMLVSGIGDMLAKYISICEWRISNVINGEYYCEKVANVIRLAVKQCVDNANGLIKRDDKAIEAVFYGLVLGGVAMNYAGCSRPASGVEHYISHILDMRGLEFGEKTDFHGIQCAIGTLIALKVYEQVKNVKPDKEKALKFVDGFDFDKYQKGLRSFLGKGADAMINAEKKDKKYDKDLHKFRIDKIIKEWDKIIKIIDEELILSKDLEKILDILGAPKKLSDIGLDDGMLKDIFVYTKDIRDKYVLSRLCFDLGILDEIKL